MRQWVTAGLAQRDYVHFLGQGYRLLGNTLFKDVMRNYDDFVKARETAVESAAEQRGTRRDSKGPHEGRILANSSPRRANMSRTLSALILGAALCAPAVVVRADDEHHEREEAKRYYDRDRKDYHEWTERENRAYRRWNEERREREYRDFTRIDRERQREYWRWRHDHPDTLLWPDRH